MQELQEERAAEAVANVREVDEYLTSVLRTSMADFLIEVMEIKLKDGLKVADLLYKRLGAYPQHGGGDTNVNVFVPIQFVPAPRRNYGYDD